jgi:hypothetical protein
VQLYMMAEKPGIWRDFYLRQKSGCFYLLIKKI